MTLFDQHPSSNQAPPPVQYNLIRVCYFAVNIKHIATLCEYCDFLLFMRTSYIRTSELHDETSRRLCPGANCIAEIPSFGGSDSSLWFPDILEGKAKGFYKFLFYILKV